MSGDGTASARGLSTAAIRDAAKDAVAATERTSSWVYFIRQGQYGNIKIGFTTGDPAIRCAALQTGNSERLHVIAAIRGAQSLEQRLHKQFARLRHQGEWFRPGEALMAFLDGVALGMATIREGDLPPPRETDPAPVPRDVTPKRPETPLEASERMRIQHVQAEALLAVLRGEPVT